MSEPLDARQSTLIKAMRFPLMVLVLYVHSLGFVDAEISNDLSGWNCYHFVSEMLSHNLGGIAVCWFYTFSGYLFFRNLKDGGFCASWVLMKWKKRVHSLLIPYLIWNLFVVVATVIKSWLFVRLGLPDDGGMAYVCQFNIAEWLWNGPINFPLYYIRDLIVMSLIAPLLYMVASKYKWCTLVILLFAYVYPLNIAIPGQRAIFFFGVGAWMGIYHINMICLCRKIEIPALIVAIVLLFVCTYFNSAPFHGHLLRAFYPFGMITFMNICDKLIDNENRCNRMCNLASAVFIIYATHEIYILGWTKGLFLRVFGDGLLGSWISYLFVPVVVLIICLCIYWLLNRFMPKTLAFVSGGRVDKK